MSIYNQNFNLLPAPNYQPDPQAMLKNSMPYFFPSLTHQTLAMNLYNQKRQFSQAFHNTDFQEAQPSKKFKANDPSQEKPSHGGKTDQSMNKFMNINSSVPIFYTGAASANKPQDFNNLKPNSNLNLNNAAEAESDDDCMIIENPVPKEVPKVQKPQIGTMPPMVNPFLQQQQQQRLSMLSNYPAYQQNNLGLLSQTYMQRAQLIQSTQRMLLKSMLENSQLANNRAISLQELGSFGQMQNNIQPQNTEQMGAKGGVICIDDEEDEIEEEKQNSSVMETKILRSFPRNKQGNLSIVIEGETFDNQLSEKDSEASQNELPKHHQFHSKMLPDTTASEMENISEDYVIDLHVDPDDPSPPISEMMVGSEYQAVVPKFQLNRKGKGVTNRRTVKPLWSPELISRQDLEGYFMMLEKTVQIDITNEENQIEFLLEHRINTETALEQVKTDLVFYRKYFKLTKRRGRRSK